MPKPLKCNACGFMCCASDVFEQCGCDCDEPDCWDEEWDEEDGFDDYLEE